MEAIILQVGCIIIVGIVIYKGFIKPTRNAIK